MKLISSPYSDSLCGTLAAVWGVLTCQFRPHLPIPDYVWMCHMEVHEHCLGDDCDRFQRLCRSTGLVDMTVYSRIDKLLEISIFLHRAQHLMVLNSLLEVWSSFFFHISIVKYHEPFSTLILNILKQLWKKLILAHAVCSTAVSYELLEKAGIGKKTR